MYLNKSKLRFNGLRSRITLTFSGLFIAIMFITTLMLYLLLNTQNDVVLTEAYNVKISEIDSYFEKLNDFANKYSGQKLKLKFETVVNGDSIEYTKPFNTGEEDFKYLIHIRNNKDNMDIIALNSYGNGLEISNLDKYFNNNNLSNVQDIKTVNINFKNLDGNISNLSVIKLTRKIKSAKFDIYILKNNAQFTNTIFSLKILFIFSIILGLLLIILTSRVLSDRILKPIKNIITTAKEISKGDLSRRIEEAESKDELNDLTNIINEMLDKINLSFENQSRFISDASHELRTPITIMKGYAELIERRYIKYLTDEDKKESRNEMLIESIDSIIKESKNMANLINSLLFLSRGEENEKNMLKMVKIDSSNILKQIKNDFDLVYKGKIIIEKNTNFTFIADENLLLQSLRIIIENGIKYSEKDSKIYISSAYSNNEGIISVRDTGVGISEKDINNIFDRFYRVDESRNKNTGGYGLGLSIFKRIIEIQKQTYTIESKVGVGTKISIKIKR